MDLAAIIRELGRGAHGARDLPYAEAQTLYGAMLDGRVGDLELGAIVIALRMKTETVEEMSGFLTAATMRMPTLWRPHGQTRPIVLPTYNGARRGANLTPLLALLLRRFSIPVLVHGHSEDYGRVTSAQIFQELGLSPCTHLQQAQRTIDAHGLAYLPLSLLAPGLDRLLALRKALGLRNSAHSLVKMLDPFRGDSLLLAAATHPDYIALMRGVLNRFGTRALLFRGCEGEPFANPKRRPGMEYLHDGVCDVLFDAEHDSLRTLPQLPDTCDAAATVDWMQRILKGEVSLPLPIAQQLAACLYACGRAASIHQAKALVALECNSLALA